MLVISALCGASMGCAPKAPASTGGDTHEEAAKTDKPATPADIAEAALPSVVAVVTEEGLGSGFIVGKDGLVATNLHVIAGYSKALVVLSRWSSSISSRSRRSTSDGYKPARAVSIARSVTNRPLRYWTRTHHACRGRLASR